MTRSYLALDVGTRRIGVATADDKVRIAIALDTVEVDGNELTAIERLIATNNITDLVIGFPRNQSGEPTAQTQFVTKFAEQFADSPAKIHFQDESLTSVLAEERLKEMGGNYRKSDIDAQAACIILEDFLEHRT